jgi:NADPH:quinone reductase-like Zn-dependent oxidoreductase
MKAIVQERFGPPDSLQLVDLDQPEIGADEVLIRVHAAGLNPADWHLLRGEPKIARLMGVGLTKPKNRVAGIDVAGRVEAVGAKVTELQLGDDVFGFSLGAFAEYACAPASKVAAKPANLTFEQAAALPIAAVTALRGIQYVAQVTAGQRVLINGAGGGVGTFAVQIAKQLGAEITGVCSAENAALVKELGVEHVIDYASEDFTDGRRGPYDVILDNVGNRSLGQLCGALTSTGTLVFNAGGPPGTMIGPLLPMLGAVARNLFVRQQLKIIPALQQREDLLAVTQIVEAGNLVPVISQTYPLAETATGLRRVEDGHARGKLVVAVA